MIQADKSFDEAIRPEDIKSARQSLGMTGVEVAQALGYKCSSIVTLYETGKRPIAISFVWRWNNAFPIKLGTVDLENGKRHTWQGFLQFPLTSESSVRMEFSGVVTQSSIRKLIHHLELIIDGLEP